VFHEVGPDEQNARGPVEAVSDLGTKSLLSPEERRCGRPDKVDKRTHALVNDVATRQKAGRLIQNTIPILPTYLSELVQTREPPRALRSSDAPMLVVPRIHTELARRAFSVVAPSTWNSLPADIRLCENILTFKRHLKTHLFKLT